MYRKMLVAIAIGLAIPLALWASTTTAAVPCACCGAECVCPDCVCDATGCACDTGGDCTCSAIPCCSHCRL